MPLYVVVNHFANKMYCRWNSRHGAGGGPVSRPEGFLVPSKSSTSTFKFKLRSVRIEARTEARVHHTHVFLTYFKCSIDSIDQFEEGIRDMLKRNKLQSTSYYA